MTNRIITYALWQHHRPNAALLLSGLFIFALLMTNPGHAQAQNPTPTPAVSPSPRTQRNIVWQDSGALGLLKVWNTDLSGAVTSTQYISLLCPTSCSNEWKIVGTGDFNSDGQTDLLWLNTSNGTLSTWLLDRNYNVIGTPNLSVACSACTEGWEVAGVGDFAGNGRSDVLLFNPDLGLLVVWLLDSNDNVTGTTVINWVCGSGCSDQWKIVGVADFNDDGFADILWYNQSTGVLSTWLLDGKGNVTSNPNLSWTCGAGCSNQWTVIGTGGFDTYTNGNILWFNSATGQLSEWLLGGTDAVLGHQEVNKTCGANVGCSPPWKPVAIIN